MVANTITMKLHYGKILRKLRTAPFMGILPQGLGDYNEGRYIIVNRAGFSIKVPPRKDISTRGSGD